MYKALTFALAATLSLALAAGASYQLVVGGRSVGQTVTINGQTYLPLSAVRAAGLNVSVSGKTMTLGVTSTAQGGANPLSAQSGCLNQTLSNGVWSVKFSNLRFETADQAYPGPHWTLDLDVGNLTHQKISPAFDGGLDASNASWVTADGNTITPNGGVTRVTTQAFTYRAFLPGQHFRGPLSINSTAVLTQDRPPVKLVWTFDPSKVHMKLPWSSQDPSFRVDLTCSR